MLSAPLSLRRGLSGLAPLALLIGAGAGLGAVAFRWLISGVTHLATGQQDASLGRFTSPVLPWLGVAGVVLIPVLAGLAYGPLVSRFAPRLAGTASPR